MRILKNIQIKTKRVLYSWKKRWLGLGFPLYTKVKGVKSPTFQGALAQSKDGDKLQLVHVPSEQYPFCVFVYSVTLNRVLGYLEEDLSKKLVKLFKKDFCRDGVIYKIVGGGNYKYFGCRILVFETMEMMRSIEDFSLLRGE